MNDDQYFLANAFVDGELTADERALAESDPDVMSEVGRLRALQTRLRDVEPPTAAARESAIAAAMAEFSPVVAAPPAPAARAVPFRPRPAYRRYLAMAAAVVAVGLLGVVVVNGIGGSDQDDAGDADFEISEASDAADAGAAESETDEAVAERVMTESATSPVVEDAADMAAEESDPSADAAEAGDATASAVEGGEGDADDAADGGLEGDAVSEQMPAGDALPTGVIPIVPAEGFVDPSMIPAPVLVGEVASELIALRDDGRLGPTPNTQCAFPDADDPTEILARHEFVLDDGSVELLVAADEVNELVYGIDPDSCLIVVVGRLP